MARYMVSTPRHCAAPLPEFEHTDAIGDALRAAEFQNCSVWRHIPSMRHWALIFDTSGRDSGRLPGSLYWCNVAQNENQEGRGLRNFKSLAIGDSFAFADAVGFSIGRRFRKMTARTYVEINADGHALDTRYGVGSTGVHVVRSIQQGVQA